MLFPTLRKTKNLPTLYKNKTLPIHNPTDKNEMTEHTENIKGIFDRKEGQLVTSGHKTCRV